MYAICKMLYYLSSCVNVGKGIEMKITFTFNRKGYEIGYNIGETLADAVSLHGEKAVMDLYRAKAVIKVQDYCRTMLKKHSWKEVQSKFKKDFTLSNTKRAATPTAKAEKSTKESYNRLMALDVKERAAVIKRMYGVPIEVAEQMAKAMENKVS